MGRYVFSGDTKLGSRDKDGNTVSEPCLAFPASVTSIGQQAFEKCNAYTSVKIHKAFNEIPVDASGEEYGPFYKCTEIKVVEFEAGIEIILENLFNGTIGTGPVEFRIPDSVTTIGNSAFKGQKSLTGFAPGENSKITAIRAYAFFGCEALKSVKLPNTVTTIGKYAFQNCTALETITLPDSVSSIDELAFADCTVLKSIRLPDAVTTVSRYLFRGDKALETIGLGKNTTTIESNAFENCAALSSIAFPDSLNKIGDSAFADCNALTEVVIPASVTLVDAGAFQRCKGLQQVEFKVNNLFKDEQEIGSRVFKDCTSLKIIKLGNKVKTIRGEAFYGCTVLEEVEIPYGVKTIDSKVFSNSPALKYLFIPSSVTTISTTKSEFTLNNEQGLKIYVEKGKSEALTWAGNQGFKTEIGIYETREEFPDEAFFSKMNSQLFDKNLDTRLTLREIEQIKTLNISSLDIADMTGLGLLTSVESLDCSKNKITELDTSALTLLKTLNCASNQISALNVSNNLLETLNCGNNALPAIDLSKVPALKNLHCAVNQLKALDISTNPAIEDLDCSKNNLTELNLQSNLSLKTLLCTDNKLARLDTSNNALLERLECGNNKLAMMETAGNPSMAALEGGSQEITIVKTADGGKAYLDIKAYDDRFDYAKVSALTLYKDDAAVENADVEKSDNAIAVPNDAEKISYQYSITDSFKMNVTVKIVGKPEEEPVEEPAKNIADLDISAFTDKIYTGKETQQVITIYDGMYRLKTDTDYTAEYKDNIEAGTASVTIKGIGKKYTGTYTGNYQIKPEWKDISIKSIPDQVYQNKNIEPSLTVKLGGKILEKDKDYLADYVNNKNAGVATIVITGKDQYESAGMKELSFNIVECSIARVTFPQMTDVIYDGTEKTPVPTISHNGVLMKAGTDYTLSYSKNVKAGKGVMTFAGIGNYTGTVNKTFTIQKCDLSKLSDSEILVETQVPFSMTGAKAAVAIKLSSGVTLAEGVDYTLSYSNNKNAGVADAKVTIKGKGSCSGKKTMTFEVIPQSIKDASLQITIAVAQKDSKGRQLKPNITITQDKKKLREGETKDYTVTYNAEDTVNSGEVTVTITGKNNYKDETTADFIIVDRLIAKAKIKGVQNYEYSGDEIEQDETGIKVMLGNEEVPANFYDISYDRNTEAGNAVITATANPDVCDYKFGGSATAAFKIAPVKFSNTEKRVEANLVNDSIVYNGQKQSPDVIVTDKKPGTVLKEDEDYTLSYSNNQNAGTRGKVTIKGKGNYSGTIALPFSIKAKNMTEYEDDFTVIMRNSAYTGKKISPRIMVMDGDIMLKQGKDYTLDVKYPEGLNEIKEKGRYAVTIEGKGNYTGNLSEHALYVY